MGRSVRNIVILVVLMACGIFAFYTGFRIEYLLGITILSALFYYVTIMTQEKYVLSDIFAKRFKHSDIDTIRKKVFDNSTFFYSFLLLIMVYLCSLFTIGCITDPGGQHPYFNNANHNALVNEAIIPVSASHSLTLYNEEDRINEAGLFPSDSGKLSIEFKAGDASLKADNFLSPIFTYDSTDKKYYTVNNPYDESIESGFTISNGVSSLQFVLVEEMKAGIKERLFNRESNDYHLKLIYSTKDSDLLQPVQLSGEYKDTFELKQSLGKGLKLRDLVKKATGSNVIKTGNILTEELMLELHDCIVLSGKIKGKKCLTFFPSKKYFESDYKVSLNDKPLVCNLDERIAIKAGQRFFTGFYNSNEKMYVGSVTNKDLRLESRPVLFFDFPAHHIFEAPSPGSPLNAQNDYFIANHYTQLSEISGNEGFLIHDDLRNSSSNFVRGKIIFEKGKPNTPITAQVIDFNNPAEPFNIDKDQQQFVLKGNNIEWLYKITNFSENPYNKWSQYIFISILLMVFLLTLLYNPGKSIERIEPVVYAVILCMFAIRQIMYWRLVTFPPTEQINKHEFGSLIHFDTNLIEGVPGGFLFIVVLMLLINTVRLIQKWKPAFFQKKSWSLFPQKLSVHLRHNNVIWQFAAALLFCFVMQKLPVEILKRLFSILVPVGFYLYYSYKTYSLQDPAYHYDRSDSRFSVIRYFHQFVINIIESPHFAITLIAFLYFLGVDRGFAIMFSLFICLKTILFSFLRKQYDSTESLKSLLLRPSNYWIYAIVFLIIYILIIGVKSSFYYILYYKTYLLLAFMVVFVIALLSQGITSIFRKGLLALSLVMALLLAFTGTNRYIDKKIDQQLRHVIYRASVIFQPIEKVISKSNYNSFDDRKIIETAQNQWFINSYIEQAYDLRYPINLRSHYNKGVDYVTQTRDLVLPRYVISELGPVTMFLLLLLLTAPLVFYLFSFPITSSAQKKLNFNPAHFIVASALLLLFTLSFFVWLSATNRIVFFGQDFPFLSLTSRLSVLLPLILFFIVLILPGKPRMVTQLNFKSRIGRTLFLSVIIITTLIISGRSHKLDSEIFNVTVSHTEQTINKKLNAVLSSIQEDDSRIEGMPDQLLESKRYRQKMKDAIDSLCNTEAFKAIEDSSDVYTKSILSFLRKHPENSLNSQSPVYVRYFNNKFQLEYNQNIYLELPVYDDKKQWKGNILGEKDSIVGSMQLFVDNKSYPLLDNPVLKSTASASVVYLPSSWLENTDSAQFIISRNATVKGKITISRSGIDKQIVMGNTAYAVSINKHDKAYVTDKANGSTSIWVEHSKPFAYVRNMLVNGRQRLVYPEGESFFWLYNYASTARQAFAKTGMLHQNSYITIDRDLQSRVQNYLSKETAKKYRKTPKFKFSVIAADGLGNIRLMADWANNRKRVDPNNSKAIAELGRDYFFYSNKENEREQWANQNIISMPMGPGSSIKPIMLASVSMMANAGWENLNLQQGSGFKTNSKGKNSTMSYAGYKLSKEGWPEQHAGDNSNCGILEYISKSNNFYHSLIMFLGSYDRDNFGKEKPDLVNVLSKTNSGYPAMLYNGETYFFHAYNTGKWPKGSTVKKIYFGNKESLLAKGLETKFNLYTSSPENSTSRTSKRVDFADTIIHGRASSLQTSNYVWSYPEESYFLQEEREANDPSLNFLSGLKNPTAGGSPMEISPLKMLEMYGRLFTMRQYEPKMIPGNQLTDTISVGVHSYWNTESEYYDFLKKYIYTGMKNVLTSGTLRALFSTHNTYNNYHFYAKTGTIGEGGKYDSKRLALIISKEDLISKGPDNKIYVLYFTGHNIDNNDYNLYRFVIDEIMSSASFKEYMK